MKSKITFDLDKYCTLCEKEMEKLRTIPTHIDGAYGCQKAGKRLTTKVVLTPDYNSCGNLTHWHIEVVE